jgi:cellulose biosynthesis protein BcsQ
MQNTQIYLGLQDIFSDERIYTIVDSEEEITSISIGSIETDEETYTVVYAFNSTVELFREPGYQTLEYMQEVASDSYDFFIFDTEAEYLEFKSH